jgi:hypothetical protein
MTAGGPGTDEAARWEAAAQVRADHPGWVVIWAQLRGEFQARPLFRAPRGTVATGQTPADLIARMTTIQAAASHCARRPPPGSASSTADSTRSESS